MKTIVAALALMMSGGAVMAQSDHYEGVVIDAEIGRLACARREDAVRIAAGPAAAFVEVAKSGRCVEWHGGDRIIISTRDYGDDVVAARQATSSPSSPFLFIDRCDIKPPACAEYYFERRLSKP